MQVVEFWFDLSAAAASAAPLLKSAEVVSAFECDLAEHLGSGAFGETWKVTTGADVEAVKVILQPAYPLERLAQEAEGLRRCSSPHVVRLNEVGRRCIGGEDRAFFRCEFVPGGDAASRLRAGGWPDIDEQVAFCRGVLRGLRALHGAHSIHRDVKFENIALRGGDWAQPVLLDLGLVRIEDRATLTAYPALMGTPAFMSPEQVRRQRAKKATDLWALGTMSFILASRRHPFYGSRASKKSEAEALAVMNAGPPDCSACPPAIRDLVEKWLDPTLYKRGSTASALKRFDEMTGEEPDDNR